MFRKILSSTLAQLVVAVVVGAVLGSVVSSEVMEVVVTIKYIFGQMILFIVPLIIFTFIASSITRMGVFASKLLSLLLSLAYMSSVGAALMAMSLGYWAIPQLNIGDAVESHRSLPPLIFELNIPPVMCVMTALVLAVLVGLSAVWRDAKEVAKLLDELQRMVLEIVNRVLIPILPIFVAANFCILSYGGSLTHQLPLFVNIFIIVLAAHFVWLMVLYLAAAVATRQNPMKVVRYYAPAYFTAVGTMSSAATLPVAIRSAKRSEILNGKVVDFSIPILSNVHLCGSIITEVFFVMAISQMLYGVLPELSTMLLFIVLLALFAVGAPGVPGGTVIASLGIVTSILGFDDAGTALLLTIFALQDSFGTAANVVGDGALTMIVNRYVLLREG